MVKGGIDPGLVKFLTALAIGALIIEALDRTVSAAAWALVGILLFGVFLNNPILIGFISNGANELAKGVQ